MSKSWSHIKYVESNLPWRPGAGEVQKMGEENQQEITREQMKAAKVFYFVAGVFVGLALAVVGVTAGLVW